jgi:hypothetical protein
LIEIAVEVAQEKLNIVEEKRQRRDPSKVSVLPPKLVIEPMVRQPRGTLLAHMGRSDRYQYIPENPQCFFETSTLATAFIPLWRARTVEFAEQSF